MIQHHVIPKQNKTKNNFLHVIVINNITLTFTKLFYQSIPFVEFLTDKENICKFLLI